MPFIEIPLPVGGINKSQSHVDSAKFPTSEYLNNVRPVDFEKRLRLAQRPGLDKWGSGNQIGGEEQPVVFITSVSSVV